MFPSQVQVPWGEPGRSTPGISSPYVMHRTAQCELSPPPVQPTDRGRRTARKNLFMSQSISGGRE